MAQIMTFLLSFGLFLATAQAEVSVRVLPATGAGVSEADLQSITELVKISVNKFKQKDMALKQDGGGADLFLQPKALKLGGAYILSVTSTDTKGESFSAELKAQSLEDMDVVAGRVVKAVLEKKSVADTATVTDITAAEENEGTRRYKATRQWQFGFGPAWSTNLNARGDGLTFSLGYTWGLDPHFDVTLMLDGYSAKDTGDAGFSNISIGTNYLFSLGKHTPFVLADFGRASAQAADGCDDGSLLCDWDSDDEASGWALSVGAGYKFFRTSTVNVGVTFRYSYLFDKTSEGYPAYSSLRLVVYY